MANINRDYLVIADLKSGKITSPNMSFYNTDKNIANLFVKLQITMSTNPSITGFVNKEEASNYNVKLSVVKPKTTMLVELTGIVQDESVMGNGAVYLFDMPQNFTDQVGKYICELEITCMVNGREEVVTCDPFEYSVKESVVTGLNIEIEPNPDVPVLRQLIDEVRYLQENGGSIVNLSGYQKMEDNSLDTNNKTVVGGINELNDSKVDKIEGKGLSTVDFTKEKDAKLSGIAEGANNYTHPINHEPSIITQDATHRFVTDVEKEIWNNKSEFSGSYNDLTEKPDIPSIDGLATEVYVDDKVASIVNSAPETLDTLNELATALGNDPNFATTVANQIGTKASNDYVNAELAKKVNSEGYVATENNYSTAEKTKLANVEDNANNYVHPENHEPSIIIQDNEHRFVTDTEKETWNNKLSEHQDISHLAVKSQVDESLSQINQSNIERDKKISSIENINAVQNAKLDTLFNSASGEMELESNSNNIKLDSSKKGTATVNYIRGNTLVNCAKENKELILNDEINVEGTTCTINDTVEGGLVDVELEGLSLNNIHPSSQYEFGCNSVNMGRFVLNKGTDKINIVINENLESWYYCDLGKVDVNLLKPNTKYTLIFSNASGLTGVKLASGDLTYQISNLASIKNNMAVITTNDMSNLPSNPKGICVYTSIVGTAGTTVNAEKVMILEGDYTNKPIPTEAFTGIKSVGEEVTLTNLVTRYSYNSAQYVATSYVDNSKVKANDICTVVVDNPSEEDMRVYLNEDLFDKAPSFIVPSKSSIKYLATVKKDYVYSADAPQQSALLKNSITHNNTINYKACLVVGDYKNSNLEYFEGSINKYKIETKSQNKNLLTLSENKVLNAWQCNYSILADGGIKITPTSTSGVSFISLGTYEVKKGKRYKLKANGIGNIGYSIVWVGNSTIEDSEFYNGVITKDRTISIGIYVDNKSLDNSATYYPQLEEVAENGQSTSFVSPKHHKKVILLDEPLRGIEGGVKDRIIKREGKLYVERKCKEVVFKGDISENWYIMENTSGSFNTFKINIEGYFYSNSVKVIADSLPFVGTIRGDVEMYTHNKICSTLLVNTETKVQALYINIPKSATVNEYLSQNPLTFVYELATPVYEEIKDLDNEFPTYEEATHISTNTVIPCNQKIQNTGIECMLKPSTLYSIHDIRTGSGTVKYNLGGTVNTSNKITTGATLTDNYLRLYGKGLTSRDVEVFEGDTPQTPYFSGMLSTFEDKKMTQEMVDSGLEKADNLGKYRVGIKVVGKNKFDSTKVTWQDNSRIGAHGGIYESTGMSCSNIIKNPFLPGVKISCNASCIAFYSNDKENSMISREYNKVNINVPSNAKYIRLEIKTTDKNTAQLEEGTVVTQYEPYKEYKTSILLGSPLLKGDEIVVNDGKLCNYHEMDVVLLDGSNKTIRIDNNKTDTMMFAIGETNVIATSSDIIGNIVCDKFITRAGKDNYNNELEGISINGKCEICINILKSKLSTQDVNGFKQWLQQNPITVVYELAEPYFEPLTPQLPRWVLDIFDNSTISIDTIIPVESRFTYTSYIPSITAMQETNKNQDDLINVSLCATDEMYMMLEPLLQSVPQTLQINERMMSKMVDLYVAMVMRGLKTIDEVPLRYREEVKKILEQLEK